MRSLVVLSFLAAALAGCGGGSGSSEEPLSAAEWRRQANAICRNIGAQVRAVPRPTNEADVLTFTATVSPLWKQEEERLRALRPPAELARQAEELADALAEINVSVLEIHIATQRRDGRRRDDAVRRGEIAVQALNERARKLELAACAGQSFP